MAATYEPIATFTVTSNLSNYTFSSIPQTYTDLIMISSSISSTGDADVYSQVNGDTGSNYSYTTVYGNGSSVTSGRASNATYFASGRCQTSPGIGIVHFQNYSNTTTYKTIISRTANSSYTFAWVNMWRSTAAINSIKIFPGGATVFNSGSTFTLYGIAAA
jgi:hypothetical protein